MEPDAPLIFLKELSVGCIHSGRSLQSFLTNSAIASSSRGDFDKVSIVPLPPLQQDRRSQPPPSQLNLLALLEKSLESALRIEAVPTDIAVGSSERFCLVHQSSQLRLPGQFTSCEAEEILEVTVEWDWEVDLRTREPACRYQLLNLLSRVCTLQLASGVAV